MLLLDDDELKLLKSINYIIYNMNNNKISFGIYIIYPSNHWLIIIFWGQLNFIIKKFLYISLVTHVKILKLYQIYY